MAWYDTKEHCPEEPCPAAQKVTAIEWNAMVMYLRDRICNFPLAAPVAGDDGKVIGYDHAGGKFDYITAGVADPLTLGTLYVDYIFEKTTDQGVNVERVVFDDTVIRRDVDDNYLSLVGGTDPYCAMINLTGQTSGWEPGSFVVYIPNATNDNLEAVMQAKGGVATPVLNVWKPIHVNEINEQDADTGVTVDGFLIKDDTIDGGTW